MLYNCRSWRIISGPWMRIFLWTSFAYNNSSIGLKVDSLMVTEPYVRCRWETRPVYLSEWQFTRAIVRLLRVIQRLAHLAMPLIGLYTCGFNILLAWSNTRGSFVIVRYLYTGKSGILVAERCVICGTGINGPVIPWLSKSTLSCELSIYWVGMWERRWYFVGLLVEYKETVYGGN